VRRANDAAVATRQPRIEDRPRIGISACLLGDEVRFDGGHKRDPFLTDVLSPHVEWIRVCPEVEVGMGTPRETLRLVRDGEGPVRMVTTRTAIDHTASMKRWARRRLQELAAEDLSGYVLKKDSPSCGMAHVKVFGRTGTPQSNGRGIFAEALLAAFPNLPVEEEGRLADPGLRQNFIERVFAYQRLRRFFAGRWTNATLADFHAAHAMSLLAHSTAGYSDLGRLVAWASKTRREHLRQAYERTFMQSMSVVATTRGHAKVLMHMAGDLKKVIDKESRHELLFAVDEYRRGLVPLTVPLALLRRHVRAHDVVCLARQTYLTPDPRELMLRNRV
jgi:uncharacterized protein YbbK (DUF523 family)/uncharacterized protein YbgA (DUF1722 family)